MKYFFAIKNNPVKMINKILRFKIKLPAIYDPGMRMNKKFNKFELILFFDKNDNINKSLKYSLY